MWLQVKLLVVTDVAARGVDIPMLDVVINYDFPAKPKLFVHRVGRVARAGRSGIAYSLLSKDELPYVPTDGVCRRWSVCSCAPKMVPSSIHSTRVEQMLICLPSVSPKP